LFRDDEKKGKLGVEIMEIFGESKTIRTWEEMVPKEKRKMDNNRNDLVQETRLSQKFSCSEFILDPSQNIGYYITELGAFKAIHFAHGISNLIFCFA
jgi:hypothetical protein